MKSDRIVCPAAPGQVEAALRLALETFLQFEAPAYPPEGVDTFRRFLADPKGKQAFLTGSLPMWVCLENGVLVGMAAMRSDTHFCLVFVKGSHHRQGIGRALMEAALDDRRERGIRRVTLNAAPYAVEFYHRLGFTETGEQTMSDGIRYTPMELRLD